jgi:hypothetical protein
VVKPVAIVAGLIWGIPASFRSGREMALAPELNSPMYAIVESSP